ncbi:hypothetical protein Daus18300_012683 [Diaporthe australafricana]|uniref:Uncharacterized protein n=1 Tax=Diaporthe australafricana TaxID=127596 RepID=A0ABR3W1V5_9PEZI
MEGASSTEVVATSTIVNSLNPTPAWSNSTTTGLTATTISGQASASASATQTPSSRQLSTGSIVGIAIGSVAGLILLILLVFFALGFRIQRERSRRHGTTTEAPELRDEHHATGATSGAPHGKAELADAEYTRRLERLHNGAKPELDGGPVRKLAWRLFSTIGSVSRREMRQVPAELGTQPPTPGPHELPGDDILQSGNEQPRQSRDAM